MSGSFRFNGISSEDLGLFIQVPPSYTFPKRNVSSVSIPGRNGEIYIDEKTYSQSERTYSVACDLKNNDLYEEVEKVIRWLNSTKGSYFRLEDSYDPRVYREATFISNGTVTNYFNQAYAFNVTFKCKPQRFLKDGEIPKYYNSSSFFIENHTGYDSKPEITVQIPESMYDSTKVVMLTIDNNNDSVSNITFNLSGDMYKGNESKVIIDSENMTVYDQNQNDLSSEVSTNGKDFPELRSGISKIELAKYDKVNVKFPKYQTAIDEYISENDGYVKSIFRPYDDIIKDKSESTFMKSYDQLLASKQETYNAKSLQSLAYEQSKSYTFRSFNTYLDSISVYMQVGLSEASLDGNEYDSYNIKVYLENSIIIVKALTDGFFRTKKTKEIIFYKANDTITEFKSSDTDTVYWYSSTHYANTYYDDETETEIEYEEYELDISGYTETIPDWLYFKVNYSGNSIVSGKKVISIDFMGNESGYYFFPKPSGLSGLFSKDRWQWITKPDSGQIDLNNHMDWKSYEGAFMRGSIGSSKTEEINVHMIEDVPEYQDIESITKDEDGNEVREVISKCHIYVTSNDGSFTNATIYVKDDETKDGWYQCVVDDDEREWNYKYHGDSLENISGTSSFIIRRIGKNNSEGYDKIDENNIPNFWYPKSYDEKTDTEIPGWPEYIDPYIYNENNAKITSLHNIDFSKDNATKIKMKVNLNAWYRYLEKVKDGKNYYSEWTYLEEGDYIEMDDDINVLKSTYIMKIDENPNEIKMPNNRAYVKSEDGEPDSEKPDWLFVNYIFNPNKPDDSEHSVTPKTIEYRANKIGLYKWDENTVWIKKIPVFIYDSYQDMVSESLENLNEEYVYLVKVAKDEKNNQLYNKFSWSFSDYTFNLAESNTLATNELADAALLSTAGQENTVIYYMDERPDYPSIPSFDNIEVEVKPDGHDKDPKQIVFKVKENYAGYYKVNNESNWKKYEGGEIILESEINVDNEIYYLDKIESSSESVTIKIVPRWWTL